MRAFSPLYVVALAAALGCQVQERHEKETYVRESVVEKQPVAPSLVLPENPQVVVVPRPPRPVVVVPPHSADVVVVPHDHGSGGCRPKTGVSVGVGVSGPRGSVGIGVSR